MPKKGVSYNRLGWLHYSHGDEEAKQKNFISHKQTSWYTWRYQLKTADGKKSLLTMICN